MHFKNSAEYKAHLKAHGITFEENESTDQVKFGLAKGILLIIVCALIGAFWAQVGNDYRKALDNDRLDKLLSQGAYRP
jgi:hypothetical protein